MKGLRGWLLYGLLITLAAAAALASRQRSSASDDRPSVESTGPAGLGALYVYLQERGYPVSVQRSALTSLPEGTRTLVIAAPDAREVGSDEVEALQRFVEAGGSLVYLAPRPIAEKQPALAYWLDLHRGGPLRSPKTESALGTDDLAGATARTWLPAGAAAGTRSLRVAADESIGTRQGAAPVAGSEEAVALWWRKMDKGEVWIAAGADIAENRRLELLDNLRFWENVAARGPLVFDEFHHTAPEPPPISRGIWAFALQVMACAAFLTYARGTRLGPPRPEIAERHRSSIEYVRSLAWLTRRAKVEPELLAELAQRLRVVLHDRLGIPLALSDADAARELALRSLLPAELFLNAMSELRRCIQSGQASPREYLKLSRALAEIERTVTGRTEAP